MAGILNFGPVWSKTGGNTPVPTNNGQFWYDASASRYFTFPNAVPYTSGNTVNSWTSRFDSGVVVPTSGFGPTYGANTYSLPNFYYAPNGSATANVANISAYIAPAANTTFTVDLSLGTIHKFTTSGNVTITLPVSVAGKSFALEIYYGGAHTIT